MFKISLITKGVILLMRNKKFYVTLILILFASFLLLTADMSRAATYESGTYSATTSGTHAIEADGTTDTYTNPTVTKTGDVSGQDDDYDWVGTNAAVWAGNGAVLTITGGTINSNAKYGNAVFSYGGTNSNTNNNQGDGTTVNISGTTITTTSNNSGGIMTTGGGIMNATNLTIKTSGGSSAAIRSDSGGGTVTVSGGTYETSGTGSPAIYSTAAITVTGADLTATNSQGVVIEGGNSVTLTSCDINANHATKNGQDTTRQAVLLYKSMSKDASSGTSAFTMTNGSITNTIGDIFCVTNTTCTIDLSNVTITNNGSGYFLRAEEQAWGTSGSNGGTVTLTANSQDISGNIAIGSTSSLTMTLKDKSTFKGQIIASSSASVSSSAVNTSATGGTVNVTVEAGSKLTLTGNSTVSSITLSDTSDVDYGNYTLTVNGTSYSSSNTLPTGTTGSTSSGATTNDDDNTTSDTDSTGDSGSSGDTGTGTDNQSNTNTNDGTSGNNSTGTSTISSSNGGCVLMSNGVLSLLGLALLMRKKIRS